MEYQKMTDTIYITKDVRVRDYDKNQYVVEYMTVVQDGKSEGQEVWHVAGYCGSPKSAHDCAMKYLGQENANLARSKAEAIFQKSPVAQDILALPGKAPKPKRPLGDKDER